jgi:hypothetical protein
MRHSTWGLVRMAPGTGIGENERGIETGRSVDLPGKPDFRVRFQRSAAGNGIDLVWNPVGG